MGLCNDHRRVHCPLQVAGNHSIYRRCGHLVTQLAGLSDTLVIEHALRLSLHDFIGIIHGLTVTN